MSAPERIWAWTWNHKYPSKQNGKTQWNGSIYPSDPEHCATEYIRADLVQALVEALRQIEQCDEYGIDAHSPQDLARAALRAIGEGEK